MMDLSENPQQDWQNISNRLRQMPFFDALNLTYFRLLYRQWQLKKSPEKIPDEIPMAQNSSSKSNFPLAYPTAIASAELLKDLPLSHYRDVSQGNKKDHYRLAARDVVLWYRPMQAGSGSSLKRKKYLSKLFQVPVEKISLGAKGTDLYVPLENHLCPLAELKILQAIEVGKSQQFAALIYQDICGSETKEAIEKIWQRPVLHCPEQTYREYFQNSPYLQKFVSPTLQGKAPTFLTPTEGEQELSYAHLAPAGHGFFGVEALLACLDQSLRPSVPKNCPLVGVLANGEDLSSMPDASMVGYVREKKIPILMLTTDKTDIDLKGGQLAIVRDASSQNTWISIIEAAQAQSQNLSALFCALGLRPGDGNSYFNTNMVLFNYQELIPIIEELREKMGEEQFLELIAPTLIENYKTINFSDKSSEKFCQLEGALSSVLLNLDRYYRLHFQRPLVHFLNIEKKFRTQFFSPIKTAFDFYMQFFSDRFKLDPQEIKLIDSSPHKNLPQIFLEHHSYKSVSTLLAAFEGTSLIDLRSLTIKGKVKIPGVILKGQVIVINSLSSTINLTHFLPLLQQLKMSPLVLENMQISILSSEKVEIRHLSN